MDQRDAGEFQDDRRKREKGGGGEEREACALEIGRLSYCSIFESFVELSFDVTAEKPFQSSSGRREQREYGASLLAGTE